MWVKTCDFPSLAYTDINCVSDIETKTWREWNTNEWYGSKNMKIQCDDCCDELEVIGPPDHNQKTRFGIYRKTGLLQAGKIVYYKQNEGNKFKYEYLYFYEARSAEEFSFWLFG